MHTYNHNQPCLDLLWWAEQSWGRMGSVTTPAPCSPSFYDWYMVWALACVWYTSGIAGHAPGPQLPGNLNTHLHSNWREHWTKKVHLTDDPHEHVHGSCYLYLQQWHLSTIGPMLILQTAYKQKLWTMFHVMVTRSREFNLALKVQCESACNTTIHAKKIDRTIWSYLGQTTSASIAQSD